ncbi:MAG: hypothetical protein U9Q83_10875 [Bacteroidota bacterium]|nr:hypothetical protein [Bacteroidota bacterium]
MKLHIKNSITTFLTTIFVCTLLIFSSCGNYDETEITMYYTDSIPKLKVFYKYYGNEKVITKEIRYYPNQQILSEGRFNENYKKTGKWIYYFENRKKQRIENFENGIKNGKYIEYYKSGKKMFSGSFLNGLPDGKWKIWNEKGILTSTMEYNKGEIVE